MASKHRSRRQILEPWQDSRAKPYIRIENVVKEYEGIAAINHLTLSIYRGEFFSILGPSGCGKTTLLRMLGGFEAPTSGKIYIDDVDVTNVPPYERPVNMMFQSYALFPHLTVQQNVAFGLKQDWIPRLEVKERVKEALDLVQMGDLAQRRPSQLSGGQKQRVALARSLVKQPKLLLLDEPMAALDKKLRERTQLELVTIQERVGITFVMVSHDQEEAMTMSSRVALMDDGQIRQVGTPHEIYEFPNSRFVADFVGNINIFEGIVLDDQPEFTLVDCEELGAEILISTSASVPVGAHVSLAVRPEKIKLTRTPPRSDREGNDANTFEGTVEDIEYLGDVSIYHVKLSHGTRILATLPNLARLTEQPITWEDRVFLHWKPENGIMLTT